MHNGQYVPSSYRLATIILKPNISYLTFKYSETLRPLLTQKSKNYALDTKY